MPFFRCTVMPPSGDIVNVDDNYIYYMDNGQKVYPKLSTVRIKQSVNTTTFNSTVCIGNHMNNIESFFDSCTALNCAPILSNTIDSVGRLFNNCASFNCPVAFPEAIRSMEYTFGYCPSFNQIVQIPHGVNSVNSLFIGCTSYNKPIKYEPYSNNRSMSSVGFSSSCSGCRNFNSPVYINTSGDANISYVYLYEAFSYCNNMGSNIIIRGYNEATRFYPSYMLRDKNTQLRVNIFTTNTAPFKVTTTASVVAKAITWTDMTNGFYNAYYNVYVYNNVQDAVTAFEEVYNSYL